MLCSLLKEGEDQRARIQKLATMLQVAEYHTGRPYYSSLGAPSEGEAPDWLYNAMRDKLLASTHMDTRRNPEIAEPAATAAAAAAAAAAPALAANANDGDTGVSDQTAETPSPPSEPSTTTAALAARARDAAFRRRFKAPSVVESSADT